MRLRSTLFVLLFACSPSFSSAQVVNLANDRSPARTIWDRRRSAMGELFGFERMAAVITQPAEAIAQAAQAFGQEDDITVLTLQFAPAEVAHA